ncbi:MAG: hypothetical protein MI923_00145 [Phycisphaerales bacterium]|nr:hypothetical protein [Phycisphaerales bacterium]
MTRAARYRVTRRLSVLAFRAYCALSYIFLLSPMIVVIGASLNGPKSTNDASFQFPPELRLAWLSLH